MVILFWCIRERGTGDQYASGSTAKRSRGCGTLGLLLKKDPQLHDRLLDQMFTNNHTYSRDPEKLDRVYAQLLESLEKYS